MSYIDQRRARRFSPFVGRTIHLCGETFACGDPRDNAGGRLQYVRKRRAWHRRRDPHCGLGPRRSPTAIG